MTVRELIEKLKTMPQDYPVLVGTFIADTVRVIREWYYGDSANPDCPVISVVEIE